MGIKLSGKKLLKGEYTNRTKIFETQMDTNTVFKQHFLECLCHLQHNVAGLENKSLNDWRNYYAYLQATIK